MKFLMRLAPLAPLACSLAAFADAGTAAESEADRQAFFAEVSRNPTTAQAVWLEMQNIFYEWEKVILVFGYAGSGDFAACEEIRDLAAQQNLDRNYRCNPVN